MFFLEKVANFTSQARESALSALAGDDSFIIHICNETDAVVTLQSLPHTVSSTCVPSFKELQTGEVGSLRIGGGRGGGAAVELQLGQERCFIGASFSSVGQSSRFAVDFARDGKAKLSDFQAKLPQAFYGSDSSSPDRAAGNRFAAFCARGDTGTFGLWSADFVREGNYTEPPKSVLVVLDGIDQLPPKPGFPNNVALRPHYVLLGMDGEHRMHFLQYIRDSFKGLLPHAFFLFEFSAAMRATPSVGLRDTAFTLDLLIEAFVSEHDRPLGHLADSLGPNLERWNNQKHPGLKESEGLPCYAEYAKVADSDRVLLQEHVDASSSLLWAAVGGCMRALSKVTETWTGFDEEASPVHRRPKLGSVEEFLSEEELDDADNEDMCALLSKHLQRSQSNHSSSGGFSPPSRRKLTEPLAQNDIPTLIRNCVGDSSRHAVLRKSILATLKESLSASSAKDALEHFCHWLPVSVREFERPGTEECPAVCFRAFSAELLSNLDDGIVTSAERLLSSVAEQSPPLQAMATNSKSGEFFFFSHDKMFLIKTISDAEAYLLHSMLPAYQEHLRRYPRSLIVRYAGLYHMKVAKGLSRFFTIMVSAFDPEYKIHETFDVKGSLYHRKKKEKESIGKDQDWYDAKRRLHLPERVTREILAAHEADAAFLMSFNVLDYSLLIGVHHLAAGHPRGSGYRDGGGLWAQGDKDIYFIGLIDFLIGFTLNKQAEHLVRTAQGHGDDASCVHPETYAFRQVKFLRDAVFEPGDEVVGTLGTLRLSGLEGHGLVNTDGPFDVSDPYLVATLGLQRARTPTVNNNLNPRWSAVLELPVNTGHKMLDLCLQVMDEDSVVTRGSDDKMGSLDIPMSRILEEKTVHLKEESLQGVRKGRISMKIQFIPA